MCRGFLCAAQGFRGSEGYVCSSSGLKHAELSGTTGTIHLRFEFEGYQKNTAIARRSMFVGISLVPLTVLDDKGCVSWNDSLPSA